MGSSQPKSGSASHATCPASAASSTRATSPAGISRDPSPSLPPTNPAVSTNFCAGPAAIRATGGQISSPHRSSASMPRSPTSAAKGCSGGDPFTGSVDVVLAGGDRLVLAWHEDGPLELGDELAGLLEDPGVNLDHPAVGLRLRRSHLQNLGLAVERVAVEDRIGVAEVLGREVGDRLARHVGDGHADRQGVDERPDDDVLALLGLTCVD